MSSNCTKKWGNSKWGGPRVEKPAPRKQALRLNQRELLSWSKHLSPTRKETKTKIWTQSYRSFQSHLNLWLRKLKWTKGLLPPKLQIQKIQIICPRRHKLIPLSNQKTWSTSQMWSQGSKETTVDKSLRPSWRLFLRPMLFSSRNAIKSCLALRLPPKLRLKRNEIKSHDQPEILKGFWPVTEARRAYSHHKNQGGRA